MGGAIVGSKSAPDDTMAMAESLRLSLSVVGAPPAGASVPKTSDAGTVLKGGRTIRESELSESKERVVIDRDGKFLHYVPSGGLVTQWWFWLAIFAAIVIVGIALAALTRGRRARRD